MDIVSRRNINNHMFNGYKVQMYLYKMPKNCLFFIYKKSLLFYFSTLHNFMFRCLKFTQTFFSIFFLLFHFLPLNVCECLLLLRWLFQCSIFCWHDQMQKNKAIFVEKNLNYLLFSCSISVKHKTD